MITRYAWRNGQFINKETGLPMQAPDRICAPLIQSDHQAYYSHASGKMIEGRTARRDDLARTGCREVDPSEGPKTCKTEKWARKLGLEHDPDGGKPKHWPDYFTGKRINA